MISKKDAIELGTQMAEALHAEGNNIAGRTAVLATKTRLMEILPSYRIQCIYADAFNAQLDILEPLPTSVR